MIADLSLGAARLISAQVPQQQSGWAAPPASTLTSSGEDISLSAIRLPTFSTFSSLALLFSAKAEPIPRHRTAPSPRHRCSANIAELGVLRILTISACTPHGA